MITSTGLTQLGFTSLTDYVLQNDGDGTYIRTWISSETQPSVSEIEAAEIVWQTNYDALEYSRLRKAKYDLLNQDEMRFDDQVNSTTTWVDAINAIKAAHPK
tara:strand:+ start:538 stop:843 length:306 start_codon:yes stop_codon:yes gene_type:complete